MLDVRPVPPTAYRDPGPSEIGRNVPLPSLPGLLRHPGIMPYPILDRGRSRGPSWLRPSRGALNTLRGATDGGGEYGSVRALGISSQGPSLCPS